MRNWRAEYAPRISQSVEQGACEVESRSTGHKPLPEFRVLATEVTQHVVQVHQITKGVAYLAVVEQVSHGVQHHIHG